jgi:hypothetical protein
VKHAKTFVNVSQIFRDAAAAPSPAREQQSQVKDQKSATGPSPHLTSDL